MRILVVLTYYLPHRTGLTLHVQRMAEALAKRGHSITILTTRFKNDLPTDEKINGVRVVRLWAPIQISRGKIMPFFPWALFQLLREHDLVNIHTPLLESSLIVLMAKLLQKRAVITHHGDLVLPSGVLNHLIQQLVFQLYKPAAKGADHLIAYSNDYAQYSYYLKPFIQKVTAIYPPIDIPQPKPKEVARLRRQWGINTNGHAIGYAGRFVEEKRPDILIKALETISQDLTNAKLVFAGEHQLKYEKYYEKLLPLISRFSNQIIFLGLLDSPQDLANFYAACDVLALPSDTECFGLVQVEAMLCGTPVVSTNTPGARTAVQLTGMGKVVPKQDPVALGKALVEILKDPSPFKKEQKHIKKFYDINRTIKQYEKTFQEAIDRA